MNSMALETGIHLGTYEFFLPLGAGGGGAMHRARDRKLVRGVAQKLHLAMTAHESWHAARMEREGSDDEARVQKDPWVFSSQCCDL